MCVSVCLSVTSDISGTGRHRPSFLHHHGKLRQASCSGGSRKLERGMQRGQLIGMALPRPIIITFVYLQLYARCCWRAYRSCILPCARYLADNWTWSNGVTGSNCFKFSTLRVENKLVAEQKGGAIAQLAPKRSATELCRLLLEFTGRLHWHRKHLGIGEA